MTFLRTLATRRWLALLAVALVISTCAFFLGRWQWHRHEHKQERADLINANYRADPRTVDAVFPGGTLVPSLQWARVSAHGHYDESKQVLVRNRPYDKAYGFEVLMPLRLDDGRTILVDRGWVPFGEDARSLPTVPGRFTGEVTVTGWARPGEQAFSTASEPMQVTAIDIGQVEKLTGTGLLDGYLVLQDEQRPDAPTPQRPVPLKEPSTDTGPHFAYALQWWGGMVLAPILVLWGVWRDRPAGPGDKPRPAPTPRRRKPRLWDTDTEEDEEISRAP